ncbi:hypothetical protein IHE45_05G045400 [Dioscorea alata]|uniref:Uncharacterized protein n=1 Tax=Dioscorea alata TaxID=55571 RepID=A0ACB7W0J7_DIOAL|nr:hypothetical protein IHE45_05G045400 [Dioscorea alata]
MPLLRALYHSFFFPLSPSPSPASAPTQPPSSPPFPKYPSTTTTTTTSLPFFPTYLPLPTTTSFSLSPNLPSKHLFPNSPYLFPFCPSSDKRFQTPPFHFRSHSSPPPSLLCPSPSSLPSPAPPPNPHLQRRRGLPLR